MVSSEAAYVGHQLDDHHAPETNGRMSVCRRCGSSTDGPVGLHHLPHERQLDRSSGWLIAQSQQSRVNELRELRAK